MESGQTSALHLGKLGAGEGNRTLVVSLGISFFSSRRQYNSIKSAAYLCAELRGIA
jgi:hypothetical protein